MKDYDGNIVVPAIYQEIYGRGKPYLTVRVGDENGYREGLITCDGQVVIPANYSHIRWHSDGEHFFCRSDESSEAYVLEECN